MATFLRSPKPVVAGCGHRANSFSGRKGGLGAGIPGSIQNNMGTTFIVLCILCLLMAAFIALGNRQVEQAAANAELAKVWVFMAAVILALGHFWPS